MHDDITPLADQIAMARRSVETASALFAESLLRAKGSEPGSFFASLAVEACRRDAALLEQCVAELARRERRARRRQIRQDNRAWRRMLLARRAAA